MARVLGYGGMLNTNGARNFAGKVASTAVASVEIAKQLILRSFDAANPLAIKVRILLGREFVRLNTVTRKYK